MARVIVKRTIYREGRLLRPGAELEYDIGKDEDISSWGREVAAPKAKAKPAKDKPDEAGDLA